MSDCDIITMYIYILDAIFALNGDPFMKYLVVIPDGMADEKAAELGGKTPMEAASKPCMDMLAKHSVVGTVSNVPHGMVPESDTANMAILSFDPKVYSKGRSPLEAVSMGLTMAPDEVAYRCNVVTLSDEGDYDDKIMIDHSADEITTAEADELIKALDAALGNEIRRFYTGVSYRHCILWRGGSDTYNFMRPHDILGQSIKEYLPHGEDGKEFYDLMRASWDILNHHPVNEARRSRGLRPANSIWLWSPGKKPDLPSFKEKWGLNAAVISAVDLIKGIGLCAEMQSIDVEGATGNVHTNYDGKAQAAIDAFKGGCDYVYIHVEGPDECGHRAEMQNKVLAIELIDRKILAPVYEYLKETGEDFKIMVLPDHPTPIRLRTHTIDPVPFFVYSSAQEYCGVDQFSEESAETTGLYISSGHTLMERVLLSDTDKIQGDPKASREDDAQGEPADAEEPTSSTENRCNGAKKKQRTFKFFSSAFDMLEIFSVSVIAVLLVFTFCFRLCRVSGHSMDKTLADGEMLITSDMFYEPKQGDIVVFHLSNQYYKEPLVKRVIAVGGQTVTINITTGNTYVDGILVNESYVYFDNGTGYDFADISVLFDTELVRKNSDGHRVMTVTVPEGEIFVMGDNRNNSSDSRNRFVGLVDEDAVLGKAILRITPFTWLY